MLKFEGAEVSDAAIATGRESAEDSSGVTNGFLTMLILNRFIEAVDWDKVVEVYASEVVDAEDLALIQQGVRAIVEGGIEAG